MKMHPYTIPDNTSLQKYAPKSIPKPPDLACGHFLEPGAGGEGVSQKIGTLKCLLLLFLTIPFYQSML